jgi:hypothetical protein
LHQALDLLGRVAGMPGLRLCDPLGYLEFLGRGEPAEYAEVLADLERRDRIDSQRSDSPLKPAPDAHIIETDGLGIEEVLKKILDIIEADSCPSSTTPASP